MGDVNNTAEAELEVAEEATEIASGNEEISEDAVGLADAQEVATSKEDSPSEQDVSEEGGNKPEVEEDDESYYYPKVYADNFFGKCHRAIDKGWEWVKEKLHLPTLTRKQKALVWDKITTGILIFLFCTPVLVLLYILLWFLLK